jgi:hypothetical protein
LTDSSKSTLGAGVEAFEFHLRLIHETGDFKWMRMSHSPAQFKGESKFGQLIPEGPLNTASRIEREPELLAQTVVLIGG